MNVPHILLLEDDLFFSHIIRRHLEDAGWRVSHASNGEDGISIADDDPPDVVLLDVTLPKKNGFQVLDAFASSERIVRVPIIMLTDLATREDVQRCQQLGACDYLIKSHLTVSKLLDTVRRRLPNGHPVVPGFSAVEALIVFGVIAVASIMGYWQYSVYQSRARDEWRIAQVRLAQSALAAASQESLLIVRCNATAPIAACRLCRTAACLNEDNRTSQYLPSRLWEQDAKAPTVCSRTAVHACLWSIEQDAPGALVLGQQKIRFFLERDWNGLRGGMTHDMRADGTID